MCDSNGAGRPYWHPMAIDNIEAGDQVIVPVRMHGRLRETGEPVAYELVQVWLGRDGKAIRLITYPDREAAVADVGGSLGAVSLW